MTPTKKTVNIEAFDRQDSAVFLRIKLGPSCAWLKYLEHWAKRADSEGLRGNPELRCEPSFTDKRKPRYTRADLERFVSQVLAVTSDLTPAPLTPHAYELDADSMRLPWRMRHARRCPKRTTPPKH